MLKPNIKYRVTLTREEREAFSHLSSLVFYWLLNKSIIFSGTYFNILISADKCYCSWLCCCKDWIIVLNCRSLSYIRFFYLVCVFYSSYLLLV
jgi:hypothetical protein